jgi:hypothetical protein
MLLIVAVTPAQAAPVAAAAAGAAAWYASIGVVGQFAVQIGVGLALAAASAGISYLVSGAGSARRRRGATVRRSPRRAACRTSSAADCSIAAGSTARRSSRGGVFFQKTIASGGTLNRYVLGYAVSDGICDGLEAVIINGTEVPVDSSAIRSWRPGTTSPATSSRSVPVGRERPGDGPDHRSYWPTPPADFLCRMPRDRVTRWAKFRQRGVSDRRHRHGLRHDGRQAHAAVGRRRHPGHQVPGARAQGLRRARPERRPWTMPRPGRGRTTPR